MQIIKKLYICGMINTKIINIMENNKLKINKLNESERQKQVNKDFIIRLDGWKGTIIEIHSAVGYEKAIYYCGKEKFEEIINKAYKKGGDKCKLKANHRLTITLYSR